MALNCDIELKSKSIFVKKLILSVVVVLNENHEAESL